MKKLYCKHINVTVDVKGPTGSGKSQIIDLLVDALKEEDVLITTFDNPNKEHSIKIVSKPKLPVQIPVVDVVLKATNFGFVISRTDGLPFEPKDCLIRITN